MKKYVGVHTRARTWEQWDWPSTERWLRSCVQVMLMLQREKESTHGRGFQAGMSGPWQSEEEDRASA